MDCLRSVETHLTWKGIPIKARCSDNKVAHEIWSNFLSLSKATANRGHVKRTIVILSEWQTLTTREISCDCWSLDVALNFLVKLCWINQSSTCGIFNLCLAKMSPLISFQFHSGCCSHFIKFNQWGFVDNSDFLCLNFGLKPKWLLLLCLLNQPRFYRELFFEKSMSKFMSCNFICLHSAKPIISRDRRV